ncbi:hypothetical protein [Niallia sp. Krafla_26]|uniref:hypothetical protein n=1 Tax=Niallia sp. Krafla_26 TaxID=3064703 RepID=UPI003D173666
MSVIGAFLPILILIVMLLFFVGIGRYFFKLGKMFFTVKFTHWMLGVYLLVLLVAAVFVPFMSDSKVMKEKITQHDQDEMMNELYNHLINGEIGPIKEFLVTQETFEHDRNYPLHIKSSTNDIGFSVYIEKKPESKGDIESFIYRSTLTINEFDFSGILEPYKLEKTADTLAIHAPNQDIHVSILGPSFPVRQLTEQSLISHSSSNNEGIIYLRIPSEVKITKDENVFLHYVKK